MNYLQRKTRTVLGALSILMLSMFIAQPASADEESMDQWEYDLQVYLWGATVRGETATGDPILLTFGTILKNLDFAAMTTFGARKNKFSMIADVIYMNLGDTQKTDGEFLGQPVAVKVDIGLEAWVLNLIGGYNFIDNGRNQLDVIAGARYLNLDVSADFKINDQKKGVSAGGNTWDGVVGIKGRHDFPDGHYFNYYGDVGGGDSKLTWQADANFAYDYKRFTGIVGYRYLKWNFSNDAPALDNQTLHGPYVSAKWSF